MSKKEELLIDLVSVFVTFALMFVILFMYLTLAKMDTFVGVLFLVLFTLSLGSMWFKYKGEKVDESRD